MTIKVKQPKKLTKGDTIEPIPSKRFPSVIRYKWTTGIILTTSPSSFDFTDECKILTIVNGREVIFWEFSDNIREKSYSKY